MSNEPPGASRDLSELLQTLPQELYSKIYDEVFNVVPNNVVVLDRSYRWPHLLHVDAASREAYAKSYFGLNTFFIHGSSEFRWVRTLCDQHVKFIKGLFFLCICGEEDPLRHFLKTMETRSRLLPLGIKKADTVRVITWYEARERFGV
ncbi:uncharacterized protein RHO25_007845 [Cercospora beticola]|uniref:F-box domain-containing protein n=1 Tax=Cercospora beticola TaxID=122368 RepID=A0ABZ0NUK9_CERBT|nr:hypothetical protein RHO25_007845 [Cercospora beticola]